MSKLLIKDINVSKDLDDDAMGRIVGGFKYDPSIFARAQKTGSKKYSSWKSTVNNVKANNTVYGLAP